MENVKWDCTADPVNDFKKMYEDFKNKKPREDAFFVIPANLIYGIIDGTAKTTNAIESLEKENAALKAELDALKKEHGATDTNVGNKEIKVGDTVYQTDGVRIYESTVTKVIYETTGIAFDESAIGNTVFLSEEKAQKGATNGTERTID